MPCRQVSTFEGRTGYGGLSGSGYRTEIECQQACGEGACCNGTTCSVKPQCQCNAAAGEVFKGVGTVCSPNPCIGRCCHQNGYCEITSQQDCQGSGKVWTQGGACEPNTCPRPCGCIGDFFAPSQIIIEVSDVSPTRINAPSLVDAQISTLSQIALTANPGNCDGQLAGNPEQQQANLTPNVGCSPYTFWAFGVINTYEVAFAVLLSPSSGLQYVFNGGRSATNGAGGIQCGLASYGPASLCINGVATITTQANVWFWAPGPDLATFGAFQCGWYRQNSQDNWKYSSSFLSRNTYSVGVNLTFVPSNPLP